MGEKWAVCGSVKRMMRDLQSTFQWAADKKSPKHTESAELTPVTLCYIAEERTVFPHPPPFGSRSHLYFLLGSKTPSTFLLLFPL